MLQSSALCGKHILCLTNRAYGKMSFPSPEKSEESILDWEKSCLAPGCLPSTSSGGNQLTNREEILPVELIFHLLPPGNTEYSCWGMFGCFPTETQSCLSGCSPDGLPGYTALRGLAFLLKQLPHQLSCAQLGLYNRGCCSGLLQWCHIHVQMNGW